MHIVGTRAAQPGAPQLTAAAPGEGNIFAHGNHVHGGGAVGNGFQKKSVYLSDEQ